MKIPGTNAGSGSISRLSPRFGDCRPKIPGPGLSNVSNVQNSNRECKRLETVVTARKQAPEAGSNRESRGGPAQADSPTRKNRCRKEEKSKSAPPVYVSIKTVSDRLFCVSCGAF